LESTPGRQQREQGRNDQSAGKLLPPRVKLLPHLVEALVEVRVQRDLGVKERRGLADLTVGKVGDYLWGAVEGG
jgi:hypothetical protein